MDPSALAGLCALLAQGKAVTPPPEGLSCPTAAAAPLSPQGPASASLAARVASPAARDGIARVAFAEAGNQGDSGLAAVVYTLLNRLQDGRWGDTVDGVLNARAQFEPVLRAGGVWRSLPPVSATAQARIDTILNLALEGRLPDLTNGARYFQNPVIVASRARTGQVSANLVNFGGATPSAVIGAHSFFIGPGRGGRPVILVAGSPPRSGSEASMFIGENRAASRSDDTGGADPAPEVDAPASPAVATAGDPSQALFVSRAGQVSASRP